MRFDKFVAESLNISRSQAAGMIKDNKILLNGEILNKTSAEVESGVVECSDEIYVGRGAIKLKGFLDFLGFDAENLECLDVGSSTGGFVQILLNNGAKSITAVDVGSSQLHKSLRDNEKIKVQENTDIREFRSDKRFDLVTCDVSFISVLMILNSLINLAKKNIIILFKPQFEVGSSVKRDKKGVIKDDKAVQNAMSKFELEAAKLGLILRVKKECSILGKEGNREYFYLFEKVKNV